MFDFDDLSSEEIPDQCLAWIILYAKKLRRTPSRQEFVYSKAVSTISICLCSIAVASQSLSLTPANTRLISKTRTPASGSLFEFGDCAAVAKPRKKQRLPGLVSAGVALANKATLDNGRQCMMDREMYTPLLIMYSVPERLLNSNSPHFVKLNSALDSWRAPLLDL